MNERVYFEDNEIEKNDNLNENFTFRVNWNDICFCVKENSIKRLKKENMIVLKELMDTYYYGLHENINSGFTMDELEIVNKPYLYDFLVRNGMVEVDDKKGLFVKRKYRI